jgi:hypothetical protein
MDSSSETAEKVFMILIWIRKEPLFSGFFFLVANLNLGNIDLLKE